MSKKGRDSFIRGMAFALDRASAWAEPRIFVSINKPMGSPSEKALELGQVVWDWLEEQGYAIDSTRRWLKEAAGARKIDLETLGRLVANSVVRGGRYWVLRRVNRAEFVFVDEDVDIYDLENAFGNDFPIRDGYYVGSSVPASYQNTTIKRALAKTFKQTQTFRGVGKGVEKRSVDLQFVREPRSITFGIEEIADYYLGVLNHQIGLYRVVSRALPDPILDGSMFNVRTW